MESKVSQLKRSLKVFKNIIFTPENETVRLAVAFFMLAIILIAVVTAARLDEAEADRSYAEIIGPEEIVFNWSQDACEPGDIPDVPARAFRDAQGRVQLIASYHVNRRLIGPDLNHLKYDCTVVMASHHDRDPARFNDREWIHSVYTTDGTTVFALVHNEYQGHQHLGQCPSGEYFNCWYNSITLAVSTDGGDSYGHAEPPRHLVASIPYRYEPDSGPLGIFNPSNIIYNADDGYYYALFHTAQYQAQPWGTSVMRTKDLADPTSWRAWDGSNFDVRFINPYTESQISLRRYIPQPVSRTAIHRMVGNVTFNTYFNRFLLVGTARADQAGPDEEVWGIYYSLSDDLINWTPRRLIMEINRHSTYQQGDPDPIAYPSLLDPDSPSRNFETTDKQVYLYFTRFNYTSGETRRDRDLIRVPIEFFKEGS